MAPARQRRFDHPFLPAVSRPTPRDRSRRDIAALGAPRARVAPAVVLAAGLAAGLACPAAAQATRPGASVSPAGDPCRGDVGGPQSPFTDETAARGIDYFVGNPANNYATAGMGSASFVDLDLDGDADIVCVGAWDGRVAIYENDGRGYFTERPANVPPIFDASGVVAGDYDGDKDMDLFVSCYLNDDVLLRNNLRFGFTDVTAQAGVGGSFGTGGGSSWGDANGDGLLDLYVANRTGSPIFSQGVLSDDPNRLYINQGDGTFVDMYSEMGLSTGDEPTLVGCFVDFDLDGDLDIYEGNDKGGLCLERSNYLYENIGGSFVDVTAQSGTESCTDTMGIGIGDFDGNGWPDLYCTHTPLAPGNALMLNNGDGTFRLAAPELGVASLALSWGCVFFDHDNDGDLALYVNNVFEPDRLYDFQGEWPAVDIAQQMNVHAGGKAYNTSAGDVDLDGDLDLLIQVAPGSVRLLINNEGQKRNWMGLNIWGVGGNQHSVGAHVRLRTGDRWQQRQVLAGGNTFRSQNETCRMFGLGDSCVADEIEVRWPDGVTRTLTNYPANRRYAIYRPLALVDPNGDGAVDAAEVAALVEAFGPVRPGTEIFDLTGDGVIDRRDLAGAVQRTMSAGPR